MVLIHRSPKCASQEIPPSSTSDPLVPPPFLLCLNNGIQTPVCMHALSLAFIAIIRDLRLQTNLQLEKKNTEEAVNKNLKLLVVHFAARTLFCSGKSGRHFFFFLLRRKPTLQGQHHLPFLQLENLQQIHICKSSQWRQSLLVLFQLYLQLQAYSFTAENFFWGGGGAEKTERHFFTANVISSLQNGLPL